MINFKTLLTKGGIPQTADEAKAELDNLLVTNDFTVENDSPFSPFFRFLKSVFTEPVLALTALLSGTILPNMYIMTANREFLVKLHGPSRNVFVLPAVAAVGELTFNRVDTVGQYIIPAGTLVQTPNLGGNVYQLKINHDVIFDDSEGMATALATATATGENHNLPVNTFNQLVEPIEGVTVKNAKHWLLTPGATEEPTESYRRRIIDVFGTAASWHTNAKYNQIITSFGIPIENIRIITDAPRGAGTADAYIYLDVGTVSSGLLATINKFIRDDGNHGVGDDVMTYAMPTQSVDITANYKLHDNAITTTNDIELFIKAAFRQNNVYQPTRPRPNGTFSISQLKTELHNQFNDLKSINFNIDDIQSALWLPTLNSLVVNND